jgi:hypothetical protein
MFDQSPFENRKCGQPPSSFRIRSAAEIIAFGWRSAFSAAIKFTGNGGLAPEVQGRPANPTRRLPISARLSASPETA